MVQVVWDMGREAGTLAKHGIQTQIALQMTTALMQNLKTDPIAFYGQVYIEHTTGASPQAHLPPHLLI